MNLVTPTDWCWFGRLCLGLIAATLMLTGCTTATPNIRGLEPGTHKQAQSDSPYYRALTIDTVTIDEASNPRPGFLRTVDPAELKAAVENTLQNANLLSENHSGPFILSVGFLYAEDMFEQKSFVGETRINTSILYSISDPTSGANVFAEAISGSYESSGVRDGISFAGRLKTAFEQSIRANISNFVDRLMMSPP